MSIPQLLHSMCAELPDADLNAIRKARGLGQAETASRSSFASFYLTSSGLANVVHDLSAEEVVTLRLLHETGEVDVSFFERLYGTFGSHGTYTQRYKYTFDAVKKNLVRRGLVVMAEVRMRGDTVQLERWRFALPPEFLPFLPSLPFETSDQPGEISDSAVRNKLLELFGGKAVIPGDPMPIRIYHGSIYLKDYPISLAVIQAWQIMAWRGALKSFKPNIAASLDPVQAALNLLSSEKWISAKSLEPALAIYCFGGQIPPAEKLLSQGWEKGMLVRLKINSIYHYRLAPLLESSSAENQAFSWLNVTSRPGLAVVDLRRVPLADLQLLNVLAHLTHENEVLLASPSILKLGRALPHQRSSALALWLADKVQTFHDALNTVNARWGKTILHENLLVARVRDLSLRVQLERELRERLVVLNEHFIAYPREAQSSVDKVLKKAGFVTKLVQSQEPS